jgi:hypothetical protein
LARAAPCRFARNCSSAASISASAALTPSRSKLPDIVTRLRVCSNTMSEYCMPQADIALAVFGRIVVEQPSSRAIGRILSPASPPPATITLSRGLTPSLTVISWIALIISSLAMVMRRGVAGTLRPIARQAFRQRGGRRGIELHPSAVE